MSGLYCSTGASQRNVAYSCRRDVRSHVGYLMIVLKLGMVDAVLSCIQGQW